MKGEFLHQLDRLTDEIVPNKLDEVMKATETMPIEPDDEIQTRKPTASRMTKALVPAVCGCLVLAIGIDVWRGGAWNTPGGVVTDPSHSGAWSSPPDTSGTPSSGSAQSCTSDEHSCRPTVSTAPTYPNVPPEPGSHGDPGPSIDIRSLEELNEMRRMAATADEAELNRYLMSIAGGAISREDLTDFLDLIDSLPFIYFLDGTVSWICHQVGHSIDTGDYYEVVYITTKAANGDWTRIEYWLSVKDIPSQIEIIKEQSGWWFPEKPILSKDGRIKVYCESRHKHPSGVGDMILWGLEVDGIFAWIYNYSNDADSIVPEDVFESVTITNISQAEDR